MNTINIKQLTKREEAELLDLQFSVQFPWYSRSDYYHNCLLENESGRRVTLIAYFNDQLAGCCHLLYESKYPYFLQNNIPEINDLSVFPEFRRNKIASTLLDELERIASLTRINVGLGVGLYRDYGNAQRMYGKRGYIMDGYGLTYNNEYIPPGKTVQVDDELLVYMVKSLNLYYK
ncbi:GNAT family N-acetyltransferase [Paenibacillus endoradicis]|uniref:GNAT family N-acetyltransferase n=1 Tax=Paenibacillus endoradicis TaxID=2972487 RepID=UPI00215965D4|nr:GNAT family N-acetyltransferase [Paenibacillus endoradicis]MCR8656422.1 GNAT family N-acetyltransferase [Paenibacillus endoradicis]